VRRDEGAAACCLPGARADEERDRQMRAVDPSDAAAPTRLSAMKEAGAEKKQGQRTTVVADHEVATHCEGAFEAGVVESRRFARRPE